jgi:hypothetical protein
MTVLHLVEADAICGQKLYFKQQDPVIEKSVLDDVKNLELEDRLETEYRRE